MSIEQVLSFAKPSLSQRNRLSKGGILTYKTLLYSQSFLLIAHDCSVYVKAQLIRTGLVLWSSKLKIQFYAIFSYLKTFSLQGHSFWDCLPKLAVTFGIGLLLPMVLIINEMVWHIWL